MDGLGNRRSWAVLLAVVDRLMSSLYDACGGGRLATQGQGDEMDERLLSCADRAIRWLTAGVTVLMVIATPAAAASAQTAEPSQVRKNVCELTAQERANFVDAVKTLKTTYHLRVGPRHLRRVRQDATAIRPSLRVGHMTAGFLPLAPRVPLGVRARASGGQSLSHNPVLGLDRPTVDGLRLRRRLHGRERQSRPQSR